MTHPPPRRDLLDVEATGRVPAGDWCVTKRSLSRARHEQSEEIGRPLGVTTSVTGWPPLTLPSKTSWHDRAGARISSSKCFAA